VLCHQIITCIVLHCAPMLHSTAVSTCTSMKTLDAQRAVCRGLLVEAGVHEAHAAAAECWATLEAFQNREDCSEGCSATTAAYSNVIISALHAASPAASQPDGAHSAHALACALLDPAVQRARLQALRPKAVSRECLRQAVSAAAGTAESAAAAGEGMVQCTACGGGRVRVQLSQRRSADEPMSAQCTCLNAQCGAQWRMREV